MISVDITEGINLAGMAFNGVWNIFTAPMMPLSGWFGASYWLLLNTKRNPQTDWIAGLKVTLSGLILGLAIIVDLIRWSQM